MPLFRLGSQRFESDSSGSFAISWHVTTALENATQVYEAFVFGLAVADDLQECSCSSMQTSVCNY
jgi:hypothetical protein